MLKLDNCMLLFKLLTLYLAHWLNRVNCILSVGAH